MQLDFKTESDAEKVRAISPYRSKSMLVVCVCGRYMMKHLGILTDFNETGSIMAIQASTEKIRIIYKENDYEQQERKINDPKDRWQYIPVKYIRHVIVNPVFSKQ